MEFNPVQTNQRPVREKIAQRLWELLRRLCSDACRGLRVNGA